MASIGGNFGFESSKSGSTGTSTQQGNSTSRRVFSQEAMDKIMQDMLASEQGLAALAQGENVSGAAGSTMKTQLTQDLLAKVAGELASLTAETVTTQEQTAKQEQQQTQSKKSGGLKTVICTELVRQGKLDRELYDAGTEHFYSLNPRVVIGYHMWARHMVPKMQTSERLSNFFLPIARARYMHITKRRKNLVGALTCILGHPVCYALSFLAKGKYYANSFDL